MKAIYQIILCLGIGLVMTLAVLSGSQAAAVPEAPGIVPQQACVSETVRSSRLNLNDPPEYPLDAQSTSGPLAPEGVFQGLALNSPEAVTVLDVPAYLWHHGCGPTSAGMVLGYWDSHGFDDLVSGNALTQTPDVDAMIASTENYDDYCVPIDSPPTLLPDLSEPPAGDEHADNSLADFMKTSQSAHDNYYGWSWFNHMDDALSGYVELVAPAYFTSVQNWYFNDFSWEAFKAEIDAGRPPVFLVDTDGDGYTDHFVPAIGYSEDGGTNQYACLNTWDQDVHWYEYQKISAGQPWGIYGATTFFISNGPPVITDTVVINEIYPHEPRWIELYNDGDEAVDMSGWEIEDSLSFPYIFPAFTLDPGATVVVYEGGNPANNTSTELYTGGIFNWFWETGYAALYHPLGVGVDFVRWGSETEPAPIGTTWTGINPDGPPYGFSTGRDSLSTDTDDGGDWCTQLPTSGAQNGDCGTCFTPGQPVLFLPADGVPVLDPTPTFEWDSTWAANEYIFQIQDDPSFSDPTVYTETLTQMTLPDPLSDGLYYWRVQGHYTNDGCDLYGPWSEVWELPLDTQPEGEILLVDDDCNNPDVQGAYTTTLDGLGVLYEVWDTCNSDIEPDLAVLSRYQTVIWFTGFAGEGPSDVTESDLGTWLDYGRCFLISSQDYLYYRGLTPFMTDYLGVGTYEEDVEFQTVITGTGEVFGGLGPYSLSFDFVNWSDRISPNGSADLAFSGNLGDAGISKDNGSYQTAFLGFPLEAVPPLGRQEIMGSFLGWCRSEAVYLPLVVR